MKRVLVHLHLDFQAPLEAALERWNTVQATIRFTALRPRRTHEHALLTPGNISEDAASQIADAIRTDAGYSRDDGLLVFTEKRLYTEEFAQLFVGGHDADETPPNVAILSLHFLRSTYERTSTQTHLLFRAVLSNILFSVGIDCGLEDHATTRGCIMDFCDHMPDIEVGLKSGPRFCRDCADYLNAEGAGFLLELAKAAREFRDLQLIDQDVTDSIVLRGKRYAEIKADFDYHVALSFAGPDRAKAMLLAEALQRAGLKVFYDEDHQARLWGRNLQIYLSELYRLRACFCIVLMSASYSKSQWTRVELEAALAHEFHTGNEYVLPIRLDDSEVSGILPTRAYLNWDDQSVETVCELVRQKLASGKLIAS